MSWLHTYGSNSSHVCFLCPWIEVGDEGPSPFASIRLDICGDSGRTMPLTWVHPEEVVSTWFYLKPGPISLQQPGQIDLICAAWQQPWEDSWFVWTISLTFKCYCIPGQQSIHSPLCQSFSPDFHSIGVWRQPLSGKCLHFSPRCDSFPCCCLCHYLVPQCKADRNQCCWDIYVTVGNVLFSARNVQWTKLDETSSK